jgi:hypothetical protein
MKPRTEDEILSRTPLKVKLGDKDYDVPLLAVMAQREWRKNLFATLAPILTTFESNLAAGSMAQGLTAALLQFPEKIAELFFAYAKALSADEREQILADATEEQLILAFEAVKAVAFPFSPTLETMRQLVKAEQASQL